MPWTLAFLIMQLEDLDLYQNSASTVADMLRSFMLWDGVSLFFFLAVSSWPFQGVLGEVQEGEFFPRVREVSPGPEPGRSNKPLRQWVKSSNLQSKWNRVDMAFVPMILLEELP